MKKKQKKRIATRTEVMWVMGIARGEEYLVNDDVYTDEFNFQRIAC